MAQLKLHAVVESLRGGIGDLVFKSVNGRAYVARKSGKTPKPPTTAQQQQRDEFTLAKPSLPILRRTRTTSRSLLPKEFPPTASPLATT